MCRDVIGEERSERKEEGRGDKKGRAAEQGSGEDDMKRRYEDMEKVGYNSIERPKAPPPRRKRKRKGSEEYKVGRGEHPRKRPMRPRGSVGRRSYVNRMTQAHERSASETRGRCHIKKLRDRVGWSGGK